MSKPISRRFHGVLDYAYAAAIFAAPELFRFKNQPVGVVLCRATGAATFLTSLCTRYELGLIRILPFKLHLLADGLTGIFSLSAPFLLGFGKHERARNTFLGFGILALVVASLTQDEEMK
ncbi:hypothetical protein B1R32_11513 [Abditibacterium utsteinense]|uniref:SPW repeat-containing integral membrane domain-containing protein n=1 Tax=Abditibacterium utsteinense TaxID=1960156 RepID=A0A2S8SQN2_9BACT|nr:hypothetical protein [Abditibacterium utsteinense]PQV63107.1 hypothetical protein B1R32_11513 [Abditibacterium utsteinense]